MVGWGVGLREWLSTYESRWFRFWASPPMLRVCFCSNSDCVAVCGVLSAHPPLLRGVCWGVGGAGVNSLVDGVEQSLLGAFARRAVVAALASLEGWASHRLRYRARASGV